ncbi:MAG: hypothetical protein M3479_01985, partial [Actinomycetota bacterium]|nr:hypothetical protein [Actinomycetota bacterium]
RSLTERLAATTILGRRTEIVPPGRPPSTEAEIVIVTAGRIADLTLRGWAATAQGREKVRAVLEGLPQISQVLDVANFEAFHASDKLGDFVVEAKVPWGFGPPEPGKATSRGGHGSTREMRVPLLISGAGVRVGAVPRNAGLVDVAPTIATLLGARPPADAKGRALVESLSV